MDIQERFDVIEEKKKYRRIDSKYKVNTFLGYNEDGHMSMVITEKGNITPISSTKLINATLKKRDDGKAVLEFDLVDSSYKTMFLVFCKDVITVCEQTGPSLAIETAVKRWKYWKKMFQIKNGDVLGIAQIKGLIGELIQLRDIFAPRYGINIAVESWMGPLMGHKDFEIENTWYEVKCVNENAIMVQISSLEQLDSEYDGHLMVCRLEETSPVNENAINLNQVVLSVINLIDDPDVLDLFRDKLKNAGYSFNNEYDSIRFMYKETLIFKISEDFPCLRRRTVPAAVGNANYSLVLNSLSDYLENAE